MQMFWWMKLGSIWSIHISISCSWWNCQKNHVSISTQLWETHRKVEAGRKTFAIQLSRKKPENSLLQTAQNKYQIIVKAYYPRNKLISHYYMKTAGATLLISEHRGSDVTHISHKRQKVVYTHIDLSPLLHHLSVNLRHYDTFPLTPGSLASARLTFPKPGENIRNIRTLLLHRRPITSFMGRALQ